ncbi:Uncharacterised protein [Klebsiella pneumoniae]|nr:Uncharacterised protein [Klebsiella pneumoniae]
MGFRNMTQLPFNVISVWSLRYIFPHPWSVYIATHELAISGFFLSRGQLTR